MLAAVPGGTAGPLEDLLATLRAQAEVLDRRLRIVEAEPAEDYRVELLAPLTARVARINDDALSLRRSAVELIEDPATRLRSEQDLHDRISGLAEGVRELHGPALPGVAAPSANPRFTLPDTSRPDRLDSGGPPATETPGSPLPGRAPRQAGSA